MKREKSPVMHREVSSITHEVKHKMVTKADRLEIKKIVDECKQMSEETSMDTLLRATEMVIAYLEGQVEERGLLSFASDALTGRNYSEIEHWIAEPIFLKLNQKSFLTGDLDVDFESP